MYCYVQQGSTEIIFRKEIASSENTEYTKKCTIEKYRKEFANPYQDAERGYIDDVIIPDETRKYIITSLIMPKVKVKNTKEARKHTRVIKEGYHEC